MPAEGKGYRLLEHTADIGLEVRAETLEGLLNQAVRGLKEIMFGPIEEIPGECRDISVAGGDPGELLVNWLNEFLFLWDTEDWIPVEVQVFEATPESARARAVGMIFDPRRHEVEREVKAATYHRLEVKKVRGEWRGRIYLDL